ncbi:thiol-disulfide oxidoreductase ResA [Abyssicoccus albus]|uniref:Peroxiredoxin n=1 Tax=Abyssicoccus albus TaxID=1817405 RepID=A0A3N5BNA4_9BACL|nr:thiol-disulfide oxidoreductase ResA [Abyssicoccus albus]RPF58049.1 peroxiredoxin [Abyssicoccus albus]
MKKKTRNMIRIIVLLIVFLMLAITLYLNFTKDKSNIEVGAQAPDFSLKSTDGETVKLSDYKGKPVILNFWGTWCEPCKEEMPDFEKTYENADGNFEILALHVKNSPQQVEQFINDLQTEISFPVILDNANGDVTKAYDIGPLPTTMVIDKEGKIEYIQQYMMTKDQLDQIVQSFEDGSKIEKIDS